MAEAFPIKYTDPLYAQLDAGTESKLGLPTGLLSSVRSKGEKSNHDQTNDLGTATVYQFTPPTRKAILDKYGIDVTLNPKNASEGAGLLLKEGLDRNQGDPSAAVGEYIGGIDRKNWGPVTKAYVNRVMVGQKGTQTTALNNDFAKFLADNPATGRAADLGSPTPASTPTSALETDFSRYLAQQEQNKANTPAPKAEPGLLDQLGGALEAGATLATGATTGALGALGGGLGGLAGSIASGDFGTPQGADNVEQAAAQGATDLTYQPRTPAGQAQAGAIGDVLQATVPALGMAGELGAAGRAVSSLKPTAAAIPEMVKPAVVQAVQAVKEAPGKVAEVFGTPANPTAGTQGSMGAAATDMATMRRANAQELPVPIDLTKGQATRTMEQQRFERETAKDPEMGAPIRERFDQQNHQVQQNIDAFLDMTGAEAPDIRAAGVAVDKALTERAGRDKAEIRVAYKDAEKAGEMASPVATDGIANLLNESVSAESTAPILKAAKAEIQRLGGASLGEDGLLVPAEFPLKNAEQLRKFINQNAGADPTNIKYAADLKRAIDASTEGAGGDLYRSARRLREQYARRYEDNAVINRLLTQKRGSADRQVAFEDVFAHSILNGSLDDVRTVRKVLQTAGPEGQQAWKEMQGQGINYIREQATKNSARDAAGKPIVSPAGLDRAITALDKDGKLAFLFGKKGAEQLRILNDVAKDLFTAPPGAVNTSNTASVLLAAFADLAVAAHTGVPAPLATSIRLLTKNVKDRKLRARVNEALSQNKF